MADDHELEVPTALAGERLDRLVALETGASRSAVANLVEQGGVRVDGEVVRQRSLRLETGQRISFEPADLVREADPPAPAADVTFRVLHEDADVVVVDKPADLVVHAGAGRTDGTLVNGLLHRYPEIEGVGQAGRPGIVHRLDLGTSGALLVARTVAAYEALVADLAARRVERVYWTLVRGVPEAGRGTIDAPIGRSRRRRTDMAVVADGRPAVTHYEVLERYSSPIECARLDCRLETGRTHQIRVHLASIGHPVVGDVRYGRRHGPFDSLDRLALHARRLAFEHPTTGERLVVESPLPRQLDELVQALA